MCSNEEKNPSPPQKWLTFVDVWLFFPGLVSERADLCRGTPMFTRQCRLPPAAGERPQTSTSIRWVREEGTGCAFLIAMVKVRVAWGCTKVRGHGLSVRSFPGVKVLLELGARVADVEALLADCVVTMETDRSRPFKKKNVLMICCGSHNSSGELN